MRFWKRCANWTMDPVTRPEASQTAFIRRRGRWRLRRRRDGHGPRKRSPSHMVTNPASGFPQASAPAFFQAARRP
jgi:hypothetical protein